VDTRVLEEQIVAKRRAPTLRDVCKDERMVPPWGGELLRPEMCNLDAYERGAGRVNPGRVNPCVASMLCVEITASAMAAGGCMLYGNDDYGHGLACKEGIRSMKLSAQTRNVVFVLGAALGQRNVP
jgi:hypothetical protein